MIKLIIFDMGGVLINFDETAYFRVLSKIIHKDPKLMEKDLTPFIIRMELGKLKMKDFYRIVLNNLHIRFKELEWNIIYENTAKPKKEVLGLARRLKKRYKIALLSNVSISRYGVAVRRLFDKSIFDKRFASCYIGLRKPDRRIYLYVLKKFNIKPSEAIFIDNLQENVDGANHVGITGIRFISYKALIKSLSKLGVI